MRVLVTGASGMLGSSVAAQAVAAGHEVHTFQRRPSGVVGVAEVLGSVTSRTDVARAASGMDAVIHLAAKVSLAGSPTEFDDVNVSGTRNVIDAGVPRVVMVSSPSVAHTGSSIVGDDALPADPEHARGDYARTKAIAERLALSADSERTHVVAIRPHLVWGPGDTQLVERIVERARRGTLPLLGHGTALIDTTYVDNAASAILAALHRIDAVHGRAYVVTNGEPRPIAEIMAEICGAAGAPMPRWRVPASLARVAGGAIESVWAARADEPPMTRFLAEQLSTAHWFDQRRTRRDLGWVPEVGLREGFERLARYYSGS